jgi:hypothetical protein
MGERLTDEQLIDLVIRASALDTRSAHLAREAVHEIRECRAAALTTRDLELLDWGLGVLSSDYNDVPHDEIAALRARLKAAPK